MKKIIISLISIIIITILGFLFFYIKNVKTIKLNNKNSFAQEQNSNMIKPEDYLGQWSEVIAGRIYVNIENKQDKIQVTYGGANSAYSHSETIYDCEYKSGELICNSAKHTDQFLSCNGISSDNDLEGFLNCIEKYPDKEKDDYKTYSDNKTRILKLKKGNKNHYIADDEEYLDDERKAEIRNNCENLGLYFKDDNETVFYKYKS